MRSELQSESSRRNSAQSTGPKTESGKQRSSQNALRHGLSGRVVVLPTEDLAVYQKFAKELVVSLHPATPLEAQLAQTIADAQWRLNRARTIEDAMLAMGNFEPEGNFTADRPEIHAALTAAKVFRDRHQAFANLALYEQRIQRAQKEALRQLKELQTERQAAEASEAQVGQAENAAPKPRTRSAAATATPCYPATYEQTEKVSFVCSTVEIIPPTPRKGPRPHPQTHPEPKAA